MALTRDSPLRLRFPADPKSATVLRERLAVWLDELGADDAEVFDIAVACNEAFANAIQHPYARKADVVDVNAVNEGKTVTIVVQDYGSWAATTEGGDEGGRGLPLMKQLMDSVRVDARIDGTFHGAMTYHAIRAIREANYDITYSRLRTRVNHLLDQAGYPQHPQLEGRWRNKQRRIFS